MVAGIDYSTKDCHIVLVDDEGVPQMGAVFKFPGKLSFDRLLTVRRTLMNEAGILHTTWAYNDVVVGIEDPRATNPKLRSMIGKLARVQGAIVQCFDEDTRVVPLNAKQWREKVGLSGGCSKDAVAEWAIKHGMEEDLAQDFYDAFVIARATLVEVSGSLVRSNASDSEDD